MEPLNNNQGNQEEGNNRFFSWKRFRENYSQFISELLDLRKGVDKLATIEEIKNKKSMSGANGWMLMCSIMIASLGLNLNSQAVIIGAMLISPLMSPILGIGLAIGINDLKVLRNAMWHFGIAIIIAIITSTLYFFLSPLGEMTEQIESRTEPTFLDILIAFFGGLAGIISVARKDISTTLPGVAIATALMPPLCVTGFGIANGQFQTAISSFYLFFLNSFFVSFATYIIVRYMRFPYKRYVNKRERRRNLVVIGLVSLIMVIPSFIIFKRVINDVQTKVKINRFIDNYFGEDKIFLDQYEVFPSDSIQKLVLKVYGNTINESKLPEYQAALDSIGVHNTQIQIIPTSDIRLEHINLLESKISGVEKLADQLEEAEQERLEQQEIIQKLQSNLEVLQLDSTTFIKVSNELKFLFPDIESVYYANAQRTDFESSGNIPVLVIDWAGNKSSSQKRRDEQKIKQFILSRVGLDTLKIIDD